MDVKELNISTPTGPKRRRMLKPRSPSEKSMYTMEKVEPKVVGEAHFAGKAKSQTWIVDSGCTQHMCNSEELFLSQNELQEDKHMMMGNGDLLKIQKEGDVGLRVRQGCARWGSMWFSQRTPWYVLW